VSPFGPTGPSDSWVHTAAEMRLATKTAIIKPTRKVRLVTNAFSNYYTFEKCFKALIYALLIVDKPHVFRNFKKSVKIVKRTTINHPMKNHHAYWFNC
jgi:hypothetical protein